LQCGSCDFCCSVWLLFADVVVSAEAVYRAEAGIRAVHARVADKPVCKKQVLSDSAGSFSTSKRRKGGRESKTRGRAPFSIAEVATAAAARDRFRPSPTVARQRKCAEFGHPSHNASHPASRRSPAWSRDRSPFTWEARHRHTGSRDAHGHCNGPGGAGCSSRAGGSGAGATSRRSKQGGASRVRARDDADAEELA